MTKADGRLRWRERSLGEGLYLWQRKTHKILPKTGEIRTDSHRKWKWNWNWIWNWNWKLKGKGKEWAERSGSAGFASSPCPAQWRLIHACAPSYYPYVCMPSYV